MFPNTEFNFEPDETMYMAGRDHQPSPQPTYITSLKEDPNGQQPEDLPSVKPTLPLVNEFVPE